jgi:hypothetical protein
MRLDQTFILSPFNALFADLTAQNITKVVGLTNQ